MKAYPPTHVDPRRPDPLAGAPDLPAPSDAALVAYVETYWTAFNETLDAYFVEQRPQMPVARNFPYHTTVVRLGEHGVIFGHAPAGLSGVRILRPAEFEPPLASLNLNDIQKRLGAPLVSFSFRPEERDVEKARIDGIRLAFKQALSLFWGVLPARAFEALALRVLEVEEIQVRATQGAPTDSGPDVVGAAFLEEPGSFVREESWGFQLLHHSEGRPSAAMIRELEAKAQTSFADLDVVCLVTSGDVSSFGNYVSVSSPRLRVWDRSVLDDVLHQHPEILRDFFLVYSRAYQEISRAEELRTSNHAQLRGRLEAIPPGRERFADLEQLTQEQVRVIFGAALGEPKTQVRTLDGVERRDILTRNNREGRFFNRVAERFAADFVVWDCKNYSDAIPAAVVRDVAMYANRAVGRLIVVVSRKGADESALPAQVREFRENDRAVLIVSDEDLLEMARRAESGGEPEGVLEDALDQLLMNV